MNWREEIARIWFSVCECDVCTLHDDVDFSVRYNNIACTYEYVEVRRTHVCVYVLYTFTCTKIATGGLLSTQSDVHSTRHSIHIVPHRIGAAFFGASRDVDDVETFCAQAQRHCGGGGGGEVDDVRVSVYCVRCCVVVAYVWFD